MYHITSKLLEQIYFSTFPNKSGRPLTFPITHYINVFSFVLKTGIAWRDLIVPLNWSTYYKMFNKWCKRGIFKLLHQSILSIALKNNLINSNSLKNLFIDSTMIKNFKDIDLLGKNHYDRNRLGNKITLIVSSNGIPLSISLTTANHNDTTQVIPAIQNIPIKIIRPKLIADGGYVSNSLKTTLKKTFNINFIYPYRKNQLQKNTTSQSTLLKQRYIVENVFSWIQNYRRIRIRYDKYSSTYLQFYYFAISQVIDRKLNNIKNLIF